MNISKLINIKYIKEVMTGANFLTWSNDNHVEKFQSALD